MTEREIGMLFNRIIKEELYDKYDPIKNFMYYGQAYHDSDQITCKKYGSEETFLNKSILIADIITRELIDRLPYGWNFIEGDVVLLAFEFAKHNYKTQNAFLIKDQSNLQNIFSNINPAKTRRLKEIRIPYRDETFLAGIHFIGMVKFNGTPYSRDNRNNVKIKRVLKEKIEESREDGSLVLNLLEKEIYTSPFLENVTAEDACFIMKQAKRNYDINYSGIIGD